MLAFIKAKREGVQVFVPNFSEGCEREEEVLFIFYPRVTHFVHPLYILCSRGSLLNRPAWIMSLWSESVNFFMFILFLVSSVDSRYGGSWSVKLAKEAYVLSFKCV